MQAASLVSATAAPRSKADTSSAKAQGGGQGANAFADLLNRAEERAETNELDAAVSAPSQETITRARKVERPLVEGGKPAGEPTLVQVGSAMALAEAGHKDDARAAAEADGALEAEDVGSAADATEVAEVGREKDRQELPANPELMAWLAGLIAVPQAAQDDAVSNALQQAGTADPDGPIPFHFPQGVAVTAKGQPSAVQDPKLNAKPVSSVNSQELRETLPAQVLVGTQAKHSTQQTTDIAKGAATQAAAPEHGQTHAQALAELKPQEPPASQDKGTVPALASQIIGEAIPKRAATPIIHTDLIDRPGEYRPGYSAQHGAPTREGLDDAGLHPNLGSSSEQGAPNSQAIIKPLSPEPTASQPQTTTPVFGIQNLRETLPTTPPPTASRPESFIQPSIHSPAFASALSGRIATRARDDQRSVAGELNSVGSADQQLEHVKTSAKSDANEVISSRQQAPEIASTELRPAGPSVVTSSSLSFRPDAVAQVQKEHSTHLASVRAGVDTHGGDGLEKGRFGSSPAEQPKHGLPEPQAVAELTRKAEGALPSQAAATPLVSQGLREISPATQQASTTRSEAFVQPSVHSPAFAPAFSARIATLARDGLELARVHLNPVDMGPVSVQLSLDGQQVRVDMTADVAATRRVLEQALPSLAGALREAGFTLSGGGVHQPPPDGRQGSSQDAGANGSSNPQGAGMPDNLSSSAGGAGGQGAAANPFREDPQTKGAFSASRLLAVGEDGAPSADGTPTSTIVRQRTGLVDVFA
jgi:flagellar hook-length control protein FliK